MKFDTSSGCQHAPVLLLDVSRLVWRAWAGKVPTGIDRTCLAYVRHYRDRAAAVIQRGNVTWVLDTETSIALFDLLLENDSCVSIRSRLLRLYPRALFRRVRAKRLAGLLYLNVGHTGLDKCGHGAWICRAKVRPIYFVHDLIPLNFPEYCRPGERQKHLQRMQSLLTLGVGVIGNSRDTLSELATFAALQSKTDIPPMLIAPLGVAKVRKATADVGMPLPTSPYFVMLGTIEGRKNHLLILNIWADMARRLGAACPKLVVIGQRGWECEQAVDMLERCDVIRSRVIELSRCNDATLRDYVAGARALLFPSFVEGYGLPLVEALSLETPVIASDLDVFRELAGTIPDYLSPLDGLGWAQLIEEYARPDSAARSAQLERLIGWQPPRWRDHFAKVDQWLAQLNFIQPPRHGPNG